MDKFALTVTISDEGTGGYRRIIARPVEGKIIGVGINRHQWFRRVRALPQVGGKAYCSYKDNYISITHSGVGAVDDFEDTILKLLEEEFEITQVNR